MIVDKLADVLEYAESSVSMPVAAQEIYKALLTDVAPHMGLADSDIDFMITRLHRKLIK